MQLNVWLGRLTPLILQLVQQEKPDILTVQEVFRGGLDVKFPDNMFTIFEQLDDLFAFSDFSPAHSTQIAHSNVKMGIATFSNYPITARRDFFTSGQYVGDLTRESYVENSRTLQVIELDVNGTALHILNHHGYWTRDAMGDSVSVEKMQIVADTVKELGDVPVILAGDFNVVPNSPAMRVFDGLLTDLAATHNVKTTLSPLRNLHDIPCDHIMINRHIIERDFRVENDVVSDHLAVILEFEINQRTERSN